MLLVGTVVSACGGEPSLSTTPDIAAPATSTTSTLDGRARPGDPLPSSVPRTSAPDAATTTTRSRTERPGSTSMPVVTTSGSLPPRETVPATAMPVVDLFYAVHVHAQNEWSPFRDPGLTDLDVDVAQGYVDQVEAIALTLDMHGARGSFHFTFGTAAGLCSHDPGFFDDLEARGHEIGIHAHSDQFLLKAADAMTDVCGRDVGTGSGLAAMAGGPDGATQASLGTSLEVFRAVGTAQLLVNVSGVCGTTSGGGNAMQPWRATPADICVDDPTGIVMIDQVSLEYVLTGGAPADIFSDREFSILAGLAEAAVSEAGSLPDDAVTVWGFVTHTNEYVRGNSPLAAPEAAALNGLDLLLTRLDPLVATGLARWSTAEQIAARVG